MAPLENNAVSSEEVKKQREPWDLSWQEFDLVLGERRLIDALNLQVNSPERALSLLGNCGLDLSLPEHKQQSERIFGEALHFLRHDLMSDDERQKWSLPRPFTELDDIRQVLLLASDQRPRKRYARLWACSLLKVMHAITNLEFSGKLEDLPHARRLIFSKIRRHLQSSSENPSEPSFFCHPCGESIPLTTVDWKEEKSRSSLIMKLIHKSENLVDDVYDYFGVRFVVKNEHDIPLLLDALLKTDIVIPHQVIAMRSRNSLVDLKKGKRLLKLTKDLSHNSCPTEKESPFSWQQIDWKPHSVTSGSGKKGRFNRFSSSSYRSIQLTVRHLVRLENPANRALLSLAAQLEHYQNTGRSDQWLNKLVPKENVRYFPLEIQIFDATSYEDSKFGPSSHESYKASQLRAARLRILGPLLQLDPELIPSQSLDE